MTQRKPALRPKKTSRDVRREGQNRSLSDAMAISDQVKLKALAAAVDKKQKRARAREGKKGLVVYVDPPVALAIKRLALNEGTTVHDLCRCALNLLLADRKQSIRA